MQDSKLTAIYVKPVVDIGTELRMLNASKSCYNYVTAPVIGLLAMIETGCTPVGFEGPAESAPSQCQQTADGKLDSDTRRRLVPCGASTAAACSLLPALDTGEVLCCGGAKGSCEGVQAAAGAT